MTRSGARSLGTLLQNCETEMITHPHRRALAGADPTSIVDEETIFGRAVRADDARAPEAP
jgi:hypothetical protein